VWVIQIQDGSPFMGQGPRNYQVPQSTAAEESLVSYMQEAFGLLATFLLTGYGESEIKHSSTFTILTDNFGVKTRHSITLRAGDASGLAHQREPLVLLALLKLSLMEGKSSAIPSLTHAVGRLLEWEQSEETDHAISTAIRKYFNVCYIRTDDIPYTFPGRSERIIGMYHLIRYCEFGTDTLGGEPKDHFEGIKVEFSDNVVREVLERRLFRINWPATISLMPMDRVT
jgi:hypothetical protein